MLGWLTIFAVLMLSSVLAMLSAKAATIPALTASLLFALLFFLSLLTRAIRGRV